MNTWFEVDKEGLRKLQEGKSKTYIIRELVQNAWDENISSCSIDISQSGSTIQIIVKDDSPEGFRDIRHAYTLYADTYKRADISKRGRFNLGEKQVFAICDKIRLTTTKGTIIFNETGRQEDTSQKTSKGTEIFLWLKGTALEAEEMEKYGRALLVPKGIKYKVNGELVKYKEPDHIFSASLSTETIVNDIYKRITRKTEIYAYESFYTESYLYEMGIPICKIDSDYSLNVMQKVPLGMDRETVPQPYLRQLFAHLLNAVHEEIPAESASETWVRIALQDKHIPKAETIKDIITKRFGEKACKFTATDPNSVDEAISHGYNIIHGSEMSKEEWENVKKFDIIPSSHSLFGSKSFETAKPYTPNREDKLAAKFATAIAKEVFGIDIVVSFISAKETQVAADYDSLNKRLRFNMAVLGKNFFNPPISEKTTEIIIHELGHEKGNHTESEYHKALCKIGARLMMKALKNRKFFKPFGGG